MCVFHNGQENAGLVEHHDPISNNVKVLLLEHGFYVCRKAEEVRLIDVQTSPPPALEVDHGTPMTTGYGTAPVAMDHCPSMTDAAVASAPRSVSRSIDVPKR